MGLVLLRYLTIAAAIAAACYSLILARAAHLFALNTAASVPAAVALVPYHAGHRAFSGMAAAGPRQAASPRGGIEPVRLPVVDSAWRRN